MAQTMSGADRVGAGTSADDAARAIDGPAALAPGDAAGAAPQGSPAAGRGPDLGLVLACLGLLVAAALLGLSKDGRAANDRRRRRMAGLLRPLIGGRR